ncbi:MAG: hypothetical protein U0412_04655 [Nitrospira sp.]
MNPAPETDALFYPFHLCHAETLTRLLARFPRVHFRDYMALQLTPFAGTTAFNDRMGGSFPELVANGRLVQGYNVSGPLTDKARAAVDHDLRDRSWRTLFHEALREDRRFQRGLFDPSHTMTIGHDVVPGPAALLRLMQPDFLEIDWTVKDLQTLSGQRLRGDLAYRFEYGLALVKTAAALHHTVTLAQAHRLAAVTDSPAHFQLLGHTLNRERITLSNQLIIRSGY